MSARPLFVFLPELSNGVARRGKPSKRVGALYRSRLKLLHPSQVSGPVVYGIRCILNGKVYVGSTVDLGVRWSAHLSDSTRGVKSKRIQDDLDHYGLTNFEIFVFEAVADVAHIEAREQHWIDQTRSMYPEHGYNAMPAIRTVSGKRGSYRVKHIAEYFATH